MFTCVWYSGVGASEGGQGEWGEQTEGGAAEGVGGKGCRCGEVEIRIGQDDGRGTQVKYHLYLQILGVFSKHLIEKFHWTMQTILLAETISKALVFGKAYHFVLYIAYVNSLFELFELFQYKLLDRN